MKAADTQTKSPEDYLKEPYARVLIPEAEGGFSAEILEFPGCYSFGDTAGETMRNLEDAAFNWIEAALEQGQTIPEPFASNEYSGKYPLRMSRSLHRKAVQIAERDKISLNSLFVGAIEARVNGEDLYGRIAQRLDDRIAKLERRIEGLMTRGVMNIALDWLAVEAQSTGRAGKSGGITMPQSVLNLNINNIIGGGQGWQK